MSQLAPRPFLRQLLDAAIASARPAVCVPPSLPTPPKGRTVVIGAGKAAAAMAQAVERHYPAPVSGAVVTRYGYALPCDSIEVSEAAHPIADEASMLAARAILRAVADLTADDLVVALISGGGSALMALPVAGVSLDQKQRFIAELMHAGAPIGILNRVRSALSQVKGGKLARAIHPARCVSLIISDVVGDDPALIASGPTVPPAHLDGDLLQNLTRYGVAVPGALEPHLKRAADRDLWCPRPDRNEVRIIASPARSLEAAASLVHKAGLNPILLGDAVEGSPADAASLHLDAWRQAPAGSVILSGGELTSTVHGSGEGGPNLELALELVRQASAHEAIWALACDTDGCDGNSEVAGALVTPDSLSRAAGMGLNPQAYLARSDSHSFFKELGDIVDTGPTRTNVNDFRALLKL